MKLLGQIDHPGQVESLKALGCDEALICTELRSQEGGMEERLLEGVMKTLEQEGMTYSLLCDRRIQEGVWTEALALLESSPALLRVMDLGLARELDEMKLTFDLDLQIGHLNDRAIKIWTESLNGVRRVALNPQMPRRQLLPFLGDLDVESEILGFGAISMYHSPRRLLSWSGVGEMTQIRSEEMGSGSYPMKESPWGSTLYYNKTLSLLPHLDELEEAGLDVFRVDLRNMGDEEVSLFKKGYFEGEDIRSDFPNPLLHGFYGENKSDSLLDKIGGRRSDMSRKVLGEVLDGKGRRLLVKCLSDEWALGVHLTCQDGKGRKHSFAFEGAEDLDGKAVLGPSRGDLIKLEAPRKFPTGTFLYDSKAPEG